MGRPLARVAAVLFDCDGVLVDADASVELRWRTFALEHGLDAPRVASLAHGRRAVDHIAAMAPGIDAAAAAAAVERGEFADAAGATACPGAVDAFSAVPYARRAVVSSSGPSLLRRRLEAAAIPPAPVVVDGMSVEHGKPHADSYLLAADRLGFDPADCLVVEDAVDGVVAGRAAGARVLGIGSDTSALTEAGAHAVAPDMSSVQFRVAGRSGGVELTLIARAASSTITRLPT